MIGLTSLVKYLFRHASYSSLETGFPYFRLSAGYTSSYHLVATCNSFVSANILSAALSTLVCAREFLFLLEPLCGGSVAKRHIRASIAPGIYSPPGTSMI